MSVVQARVMTTTEPYDHADERALIERARYDRDAFAVLYRRHVHDLATHVYRRTGDVHATEDLVADVFLAALRALPRYRYRGVPLRYWLLRIATNAVNRWARRQRHGANAILRTEQLENLPAKPDDSHGDIDPERAQHALLALSPKFQAVLSLHYFEGLSVAEVAAVVGCRVGTVKSRLARARDALRDKLNGRR
jgi:RNA polymerase sigma factor (sigma-70 family)